MHTLTGTPQDNVYIYTRTHTYAHIHAYIYTYAYTNTQARPFNLAEVTCMRNLNPSDMDKLVSINGMIIRTSNIIADIQRAHYQCRKSACMYV